jgi:threonine/homoserine/homoserine lactone efflux protein
MAGGLAAFLGVSALVIVTPGPDTALTIKNTLRGGRAGGVATALGVALGQACWTVATSAGLSAVLRASQPLFATLRWVGALYLIFLGVEALARASRRPSDPTGREGAARTGAAFYQGVLSNLTNPKMPVFFASLLPQFAPRQLPSFAALLLLGLIFCSMTLGWLTCYSIALPRAGRALAESRTRRAFEGLTGAVLVALGLRLATERP